MIIAPHLKVFRKILEYLTRPSVITQTEDQRLQVRTLASLLLGLVIAAVIFMPIWVIASPNYPASSLITAGVVLAFIVAYALSRTRFYVFGAIVLVLTIMVMVVSTMLTGSAPMLDRMHGLNFLVVAVMISRLFLPPKWTLFMLGLSLVIISSFFFVPDVPFEVTYSYLVFFIVITSLGTMGVVLGQRYKRRLMSSEERYRSVVTGISEGVILQTRDGVMQACNAAAEHMLGLTADQMMGRASIDPRRRTIHEDGSPFADEAHPALVTLRTGEALTGIVMGIQTPENDLRWISINSRPLMHAGDPLPYAVVVSFVDITTHKQHERALREAQHRYYGLFEQAHDAVFLLDLAGKHREVNQRAADLLGYTVAELQQLSFRDLSAEIGQSEKIFERLMAGEHVPAFERIFRRKDGSPIPVEINVELVRDLDGKPLHIQSIVRDISERKNKERQLRLQSAALEATANAILITDRNGLVEWSNPAFSRLTGYSSEEVQGKNPRVLVKSGQHEPSFYKAMWDTILAGQIWHGEMINRRRDGNLYTEEQTITPVKDERGNITHFVAIKQDITARKEADEALRQSEAWQRSLLDNMADLVWSIELPTYQITYLNSAVERIYGRPAFDFYQDKELWFRVIHPDDVERTQEGRVSVLHRGSHVCEYRIVRPDGDIRWISEHVQLIKDEQGQPSRLEGISSDITASKQVQMLQQAFLEDMQALQHLHLELSEIEQIDTLYHEMIAMTQQRLGIDRLGLFILDHEANTLLGTYGVGPDGAIREERYYQESITPNHWTLDIFNARDHVRFWENEAIYDNGIKIGTGWKAATTLWNGHTALGYLVMDNFLTKRPARLHETELLSVIGSIFGHLIERKQAEETLRRSEARQRALLSAIPDLVFRNHRDGTYVDYHAVNPNELLVPPEQLIGRKIAEIMPPDIAQIQMNYIERAWQRGEEQKYEYALSVDGQQMNYEARMVVSGQDEVITIVRNITERKQAQQRELEFVLEKERMHLLTQFIQSAAHEFRTPLSVIKTHTYLMALVDDPEKRKVKATTIDNQVKRMAKLVDMLLKMSALESTTVRPQFSTNLSTVIEAVCRDMIGSYGNNPTLHYTKRTDLPPVSANIEDLMEAFRQILDNAYRFTAPEGTITVVVDREDGHVWLKVRDTGSGIPEDSLPHIFETFWRRDEAHSTPGFGLGLPIARKIVNGHGGRIEVESQVGKGSTFSIVLPITGNG